MKFCDFAQGLYRHCAKGANPGNFVITLFGAILDEGAMDSCAILDAKPDTAYRYYKGTRSLKNAEIAFVTSHLDKSKFQDWLLECTPDVISNLSNQLTEWEIANDGTDADVTAKYSDLFERILLEAVGTKKALDPGDTARVKSADEDMTLAFDRVVQIEKLIEQLPAPKAVSVPCEIQDDERLYINELILAYGDAEQKDQFSEDDLPNFPDYSDDLEGRRIDYFAAESVRRGILEFGNGRLSNQFDVLKAETLSGVKDTEKRRHLDGYERMLAVMEQAVALPVTNYLLSQSPNWISGSIKKGVCHFLVNDRRLRWVKRNGQ